MVENEDLEIAGRRWFAYPPLRNALIAGVITGVAFVLDYGALIPHIAAIPIYVLAMIIGGFHWGREGLEAVVKERRIGIDILMIVAALGSIALNFWEDAAFLVFLYGAAEGIEEFSYARTRASIRELLQLAPKEARVLRDGAEVMIPAKKLAIGDLFVVQPSERIATDGVIVKGRTSINEAPVTGESVPVEKGEGARVFAATINEEALITVRAETTFEDNTISRIIHMVEEAQEVKGERQLFIERFGNVYSPVVLVSALLLFVVPPLFGEPLAFWGDRAVVLLIAAAPCALVMSTPVAIAAGIGRAGKSGVLVKGGVHLESLGRIKVVAFDKTGTLTIGEPEVTDIVPMHGGSNDDILNLACIVERCSAHPLARAIVRKGTEQQVGKGEVGEACALPGLGAKVEVEKCVVFIGKPELFKDAVNFAQAEEQFQRLVGEGKTVVLIGMLDRVDGVIGLRDQIRPAAKGAIAALHRMGLKSVMLTGDNRRTAEIVAQELGIDDVRSDLTPESKIEAVKLLEEQVGAVAMVGDGINDAPALAQATVGIAMGAAGTDAAVEAADVALMADDLCQLPFAFRLGQRAKRIGDQNIVFAICVLAVLIPSALLGIITIALAVIFHEASELIAVTNGLRVGREGAQKD
jgi:Cd2+/Zn2+-exporting ATPase